MLRIWTGIILFLDLAAVFANKDDVSFTSGKPWGEYTGNCVIKIKKKNTNLLTTLILNSYRS
jgi:hypothetical protein